MNRTHVFVLSLALSLSGLAVAQNPAIAQPQPGVSQPQPGVATEEPAIAQPAASVNQERAQIQNLVQNLDQAAVNNDTAFLDRVLAPNYQAVNPQGVREDKGDILKAHRNHDVKYESVEDRGQEIQVAGDTAVERSTSDVKGVYKGQRFDGVYASTRNFQRLPDGSWQIVSFEVHQLK
jgi:ketosteroid isomerase-like protein